MEEGASTSHSSETDAEHTEHTTGSEETTHDATAPTPDAESTRPADTEDEEEEEHETAEINKNPTEKATASTSHATPHLIDAVTNALDATIEKDRSVDLREKDQQITDLNTRLQAQRAEDRDKTRELEKLRENLRRLRLNQQQNSGSLTPAASTIRDISIPASLPGSADEIRDALHEQSTTFATLQRQNTFSNTVLQDIPTLDMKNTSILEDWFADIEAAAELLQESRKTVAIAKSRGFARKLIKENETTPWTEIQELLRQKLCNTNQHTHVSALLEFPTKR